MKQENVYSKPWFAALEKADPQLSKMIRKKIAVKKSEAVCTICSNQAHRDYAIVAPRCLSPVRLCAPCRDLYNETFGPEAVMPFASRAQDTVFTPCEIRVYHGNSIIFTHLPAVGGRHRHGGWGS